MSVDQQIPEPFRLSQRVRNRKHVIEDPVFLFKIKTSLEDVCSPAVGTQVVNNLYTDNLVLVQFEIERHKGEVRRHSDTVVVKVNSQHHKKGMLVVNSRKNCHHWTMDKGGEGRKNDDKILPSK